MLLFNVVVPTVPRYAVMAALVSLNLRSGDGSAVDVMIPSELPPDGIMTSQRAILTMLPDAVKVEFTEEPSQNCAGTGGVFRMDRQDVLDFVKTYLP